MSDVREQMAGRPDAPRPRRALRIRMLNAIAIVLSAVISLFSMVTVDHIVTAESESERVDEVYRLCSGAARDLQEASDYLTSEARVYVVTGHREYLDAYLTELQVTDRRGTAVDTLRTHLGKQGEGVVELEKALDYSDFLAERELYAMRLTADATNLEDPPELLAQVELNAADDALPAAEKLALAEQMVLGDEYQTIKEQVRLSVHSCLDRQLDQLNRRVVASNDELRQWLRNMQIAIVLLLGIVVFVIFAVIFLILWPLAAFTHEIKQGEPLTLAGADELRYLADAYNTIYAENRERTMHLRYAAERDSLTGLYNRRAYDQLLADNEYDMALLLIDVDYFKSVNDTYGHDAGDAVLRKVARLLEKSFRTTDLPCRIGGDEFAVIMTGVTPSLRHVICDKILTVTNVLRDTSDGLPKVTLSIGIVFSERHPGEEDLYKAADRALYVVKEAGRDGYAFYDEVVGEGDSVVG